MTQQPHTVEPCTIEITFDDDHRPFEAGDKLVGSVVVQINEPTDDVKVRLEQRWQVAGQDTWHVSERDAIVLFDGDWTTPRRVEYPFIFHIPPGPYTYHGGLFNLDWTLHASASAADGAVGQADAGFVVDASGGEQRFILGDTSSSTADSTADTSAPLSGPERVLWGIGALLLLTVGLWLLYPTVAAAESAGWMSLLAGIGCVGLAGASGRRLLVASRGPIDADQTPPATDYETQPGDRISFVVDLQPNAQTTPKRVTALLKGYERVLCDDQTPRQPKVRRFYETSVDIEPVNDNGADTDAPTSFRVTCQIPADAAYSFWCPGAQITWAIEVHVDVGSWPDWHRDFPLVVRPQVATSKRDESAQTGRIDLA